MKLASIIRLAAKNLYHNFSRSILTLCSLIMLSVVIITLSNLLYNFRVNNKLNLTEYVKDNGIGVDIRYYNKQNKGREYEDGKLEKDAIANFLERTEAMGISYEYEFQLMNSDSYYGVMNDGYSISLKPCLGGKVMRGGNPDLIEGEYWKTEDAGKSCIWLEKNISISQNINIGDTLPLTINGNRYHFTVKGLVDSHNSFIDYSYFNVSGISIYDNVNRYEDLSILKGLKELKKTETENTKIMGTTLEMEQLLNLYFLMTLAILLFLAVLCIILSLSCILNTLKISIEGNSQSIGIMKALGMRNNKISQYILAEVGILILVSTIISTFISYLISYLTLESQLKNIFSVWYIVVYHEIAGKFYFLLPVLNVLVLTAAVFLGAIKMLRKYFKNDAISIISEAQ